MKMSTIKKKKKIEQKNQKRLNLLKKVPAQPRLRLKCQIMLKNLQIKKDKKKAPG